eukprot:GHVO01023698.1.p1 GENE.GHVO01023698.1~~GHVO01023698.1.p1  ORF type:complete len:408 (+),score=48.15 GHVO01023698.1:44-1225(+)
MKTQTPKGEEAEAPPKVGIMRLGFSIALYMTVSIGIVYLNRYLFKYSLQLPLTVTFVQMVIAMWCSAAMGWGKDISIRGWKPFGCFHFWPYFRIQWPVFKNVFPLALSYVLMIIFNNLCLKYVWVSTYQVARSTTILFNIILTRLVLRVGVSLKAVSACLIVCSGMVVGAFDPESLTPLGLILGTIGSLFWAAYSVSVKKYLQYVENEEFALLNYNVTWASLLLIPPIIISGELWEIPMAFMPLSPMGWFLLFLSGIVAFCMAIAVFMLIKASSPLTFNIIGTVKASIQSLGGYVVFNETATPQALFGIVLSIGGSFFYSLAKRSQPEVLITTPSAVDRAIDWISNRVLGKGLADEGRGEYTALNQIDWNEEEEEKEEEASHTQDDDTPGMSL